MKKLLLMTFLSFNLLNADDRTQYRNDLKCYLYYRIDEYSEILPFVDDEHLPYIKGYVNSCYDTIQFMNTLDYQNGEPK